MTIRSLFAWGAAVGLLVSLAVPSRAVMIQIAGWYPEFHGSSLTSPFEIRIDYDESYGSIHLPVGTTLTQMGEQGMTDWDYFLLPAAGIRDFWAKSYFRTPNPKTYKWDAHPISWSDGHWYGAASAEYPGYLFFGADILGGAMTHYVGGGFSSPQGGIDLGDLFEYNGVFSGDLTHDLSGVFGPGDWNRFGAEVWYTARVNPDATIPDDLSMAAAVGLPLASLIAWHGRRRFGRATGPVTV